MQNLSFKLNPHECAHKYTHVLNTVGKPTHSHICPVAESSVLSNECFSQSENGHKMNEYSDLRELLEIAALSSPSPLWDS